jgi:phosphatidylinositol alpha-mannosyltransferase
MTAVSPAATNYVKTITSRHILIVPNGIDLKKYTHGKKQKPPEDKTILYIGRLEKRKAVKYLLVAYALLKQKDPSYRLLIAGNGPDRTKLEDFIDEQSIKDVDFLGYVSEEDKLRLLQTSSVFCSPAMFGESFGIVLLEAMATGCVVVAGNNAGYSGVMTDTGQLSLVNPKDPVEFARRLDLLASDKRLRKAWLEWAEEEVDQYDYDRVVDHYLAIYKAAYAKKQQKP